MASSFSNIPQSDLPTMYDLPSENQQEESGFPDYFNFLQATFLHYTFQPTNWNPDLVYNAVSMYLYYDVNNTLLYKRPDWFGVVGVERLYQGHDLRLSYVTWQEKANPSVVIEFLSPGTEEENLGTTEQAENKPRQNGMYTVIFCKSPTM